jgi:hypothetical protein
MITNQSDSHYSMIDIVAFASKSLWNAANNNADINGAGNVIRKVAPDAISEAEGVEDGKARALVVHPVRFVVIPSRTQKTSNGGSKRSRERYTTL